MVAVTSSVAYFSYEDPQNLVFGLPVFRSAQNGVRARLAWAGEGCGKRWGCLSVVIGRQAVEWVLISVSAALVW